MDFGRRIALLLGVVIVGGSLTACSASSSRAGTSSISNRPTTSTSAATASTSNGATVGAGTRAVPTAAVESTELPTATSTDTEGGYPGHERPRLTDGTEASCVLHFPQSLVQDAFGGESPVLDPQDDGTGNRALPDGTAAIYACTYTVNRGDPTNYLPEIQMQALYNWPDSPATAAARDIAQMENPQGQGEPLSADHFKVIAGGVPGYAGSVGIALAGDNGFENHLYYVKPNNTLFIFQFQSSPTHSLAAQAEQHVLSQVKLY